MQDTNGNEARVGIFVDCDNVSPEILEYAQQMAAQFGRIVLRRGYGNQATLGNKWQEALVRQAFTPCLQFQYVSGKNTADIALSLDALEALFDQRADTFCFVTSDSDFTYLCRKLRERGAVVCIVGESKTPAPLRNASDQFFEWEPAPAANGKKTANAAGEASGERQSGRGSPQDIENAVRRLASDTPEGRVNLGALGNYLKRADPSFSPQKFGHSTLLKLVSTNAALSVKQENNVHWVSLAETGKKSAKTRKSAAKTRSAAEKTAEGGNP